MNEVCLIINGQRITDFSEVPPITIDCSDYQLLLIDNQMIQNKMIVFKDNKIFVTADLMKDAEIYKQYPKNELIKIKHFEVLQNEKGIR